MGRESRSWMVYSPDGGEGGSGSPGPNPTDGAPVTASRPGGNSLLQGSSGSNPPVAQGGSNPSGNGTSSVFDPSELIPAEYREEPSLKAFLQANNPEDFFGKVFKSYVHAQKAIGAKGVPLPGEKSSPEDWKAFWDKIPGRAKTADDLGVSEDLKDTASQVIMDEDMRSFKQVLHDSGLTAPQARAVLDFAVKTMSQRAEEGRAQQFGMSAEEARLALSREWGDATDRNIELAATLARRELGGDQELMDLLNRSGVGNHPTMIKFMANMAKNVFDDQLREGLGTSSGGFSGALAAQQKAEQLKSDPNFVKAWINKSDPGHKAAVEQMNALYKQMGGK